MDDTVKQLRALPREELITMAKEWGCKINMKSNNKQLAMSIRKKQLAKSGEVKQQDGGGALNGGDSTVLPQVAASPAGVNDEFLELTDPAVPPSDQTAPKKDGRGGVRPGAGRPLGVTNEKSAVAKLPTLPNESVVAAFKMLFAAWEAGIKVDGVALTDEEARSMALPVTQLIEFYCPGQIPEIAWTWVMAAWSVGSVTLLRIKLIKAAREKIGNDNTNIETATPASAA